MAAPSSDLGLTATTSTQHGASGAVTSTVVYIEQKIVLDIIPQFSSPSWMYLSISQGNKVYPALSWTIAKKIVAFVT